MRPFLILEHTQLSESKANIMPMSQHGATNCMDSIKYPYYALVHTLNLNPQMDADGHR